MPLPFQLDASERIVSRPPVLRQVDGLRDVWRADGSGITKAFKNEHTGSQKAGLRYERKVISHLSGLLERDENDFEVRPWLGFRDANGNGLAQPDAIYIRPVRALTERSSVRALTQRSVVIFEIKLQHTANSWWQLRGLYQPLVEKLTEPRFEMSRSAYPVRVCEVCASYDPSVVFPEGVELFFDEKGFHAWTEAPGDTFGVWQLKV